MSLKSFNITKKMPLKGFNVTNKMSLKVLISPTKYPKKALILPIKMSPKQNLINYNNYKCYYIVINVIIGYEFWKILLPFIT
jgi:hypothetical protein